MQTSFYQVKLSLLYVALSMDAPSMQNEGRVYGIYSMIAVILKHGKNIMDAQAQMKISLKADEVY